MKKMLMVAVVLSSACAYAGGGMVMKGSSFSCKPWPAKIEKLAEGDVVKCITLAEKTGTFKTGSSLVGVVKEADGYRHINWQHLTTKDGLDVNLTGSEASVLQSTMTKKRNVLTVVAMRDVTITLPE